MPFCLFTQLYLYQCIGHRRQTQGPRTEPSPPPCFILPGTLFVPAAAPSSLPLIKEQLHLYSPKITCGPLKATAGLMWPPVKMSLTPWYIDRCLEYYFYMVEHTR